GTESCQAVPRNGEILALANLAIRHQRTDAIAFTIELPRNNRCARLAALALFAARASFAILTATTGPALSAQQLPIVTGTDARIVAASDESGSIKRSRSCFSRASYAADIHRALARARRIARQRQVRNERARGIDHCIEIRMHCNGRSH